MSDSFKDRRRALEDDFFQKQEQEAIQRLRNKNNPAQPRLSPVNGKPMEQISSNGVVMYRCTESGGIFLDAGELEQLLKAANANDASFGTWLSSFFAKNSK